MGLEGMKRVSTAFRNGALYVESLLEGLVMFHTQTSLQDASVLKQKKNTHSKINSGITYIIY